MVKKVIKALVTGAEGFIGRNLRLSLIERGFEVSSFTRDSTFTELEKLVRDSDVVFHLAGANRPDNEVDFVTDNVELTEFICETLSLNSSERSLKQVLVFSSSVGATLDTSYGRSKAAAEEIIRQYANSRKLNASIIRLPNIYGMGSKPNYNSVVATFCVNTISGLPMAVHDPDKTLSLLHIDDAVIELIDAYEAVLEQDENLVVPELTQVDQITLGRLADLIRKFDDQRRLGIVGKIGVGFERKLFSTYISYLTPDDFIETLDAKVDERGSFAEFVKTEESGQISVFKCTPGEVRGRHYHHTKIERFHVVHGEMRVKFVNVFSGVEYERELSADSHKVIWAIPGWWHSFENIGQEVAIALVWASEIFDPNAADTFRFIEDKL